MPRLGQFHSSPARRILLAIALLAGLALPLPGRSASAASILPAGFQDSVVFSGLINPTAFQFAADGRVFVAQKNGRIVVFDSLADNTPTLFADLSTQVVDFWDRGLLGMALDPGFTTGRPYVYVMYTYDAEPGGTAPRWNDACPSPPGPNTDGCLVTGRISKLTAAGSVMTGPENPLITDWCQQFPSHSIGTLQFGSDGALYAGAGDGASFTTVDYGQLGAANPGGRANPCGDPPGVVGTALSPPTAQGGALRSQSVRRPSGPTTLDGTIIRIDPDTGAGLAGNPYAASTDANKRRVIASGLRNPFRFTTRPGTDQLWLGDVGAGSYEEINKIAAAGDGVAENFGWPCYEGVGTQPGYAGANLDACRTLGSSAVTAPVLSYLHSAKVVPGESCPTGSSSIAGLAFYGGGGYPSAYNGALFFADHSRNCIWAMLPGTNGEPNPANIQTFAAGAPGPVYLAAGPGGDLFYAAFDQGTVRRISYLGANRAPTAVLDANPTSGPVPLRVQFDASRSTDPEGGPLIYSWDLDGDGTYGDSTAAQPSYTFDAGGTHVVRLRVTDPGGASDTASTSIAVGDAAPTPRIDSPTAAVSWQVGAPVSFSGGAVDGAGGAMPPSALSWTLVMQHCPSNCHAHNVQSWNGVAGGSFSAPDHDYPSHLELRLTATDSAGRSGTTSVMLNPATAKMQMKSTPISGVRLTVDTTAKATPYAVTVIKGHTASVSAPLRVWRSGQSYRFVKWSDGGAAAHSVRISGWKALTATYRRG